MTALMLIHVYATSYVVYHGARARNPLWNELRASLSSVVVLVLWGLAHG